MVLTFLFVVVLGQLVHASSRSTVTIAPSCYNVSTGNCFTLKNCLLSLSSCFASHSVIEFYPGDHFTERLREFAVIRDKQNLTLKVKSGVDSGSGASLANIYCSKPIGFAFFNISFLNIVGIGFHGCGFPISTSLYDEANTLQTMTYYYYFEGTKMALFLVNTFNTHINNIHVNDSDGYGLFIINALGSSSISHSHFSYNNFRALRYHQHNPGYCDPGHNLPNVTNCTGGNLVVLFQDEARCNWPFQQEYVLLITHSTFSYGVNLDYVSSDPPPYYVYNAGGVSVFTGQVSYSITVQIDNIVAHNNIGHNGANTVICIHDLKGIDTLINIENSYFINGNSDLKFSANVAYAGGLYVYYGDCACGYDGICAQHGRNRQDDRNLIVRNCTFVNNHGFKGAAILLESVIDDQDLNNKVENFTFFVLDCKIKNNTGYVGIVKVSVTRTSTDSTYHLEFSLSSTIISHNHLMDVMFGSLLQSLPERNFLSTVGIFRLPALFQNNTISFNSLVGLHLEMCEVDFRGDSYISGNNVYGGFGGGIRLYRAVMVLWNGSIINVLGNNADFGGAIYVDYIFRYIKQPCFFDVERGSDLRFDTPKRIKLAHNQATLAGNSIYGGYIENCTLPNSGSYIKGTDALPILFDIPWNNSLTEVSSKVHQLCFCENGLPKCDLQRKQVAIFPGQEILIPAVAVGQLKGTVPSVVLSEIMDQRSAAASLGDQQDVQQLSVICGNLRYQIRALENSNVEINLQTSVQRQQKPAQSINNNLKVYVNITFCPLGFTQDNETDREGCDCIAFLKEKGVTCNIVDVSFERTPPLWIGFENNSGPGLILAHDSCPFDYCDRNASRFMLNTSDTLCRFQRTGILCGRCKQGLSAVFGSSQCKRCSNAYSALVLAFTVAGFVLVLVLIYLDLTVADGTLNGLIFYANIVKIHQAIIFPAGHTNIVTVLISWLNLDLGLEVCFYDGFDVHTRTWLQFLFPVYIWIIIIIIIVLGWHLTVVAKIVGSNSIPVLATLFLMSYTKLQRTILESLSFTRVESHLGQSFYVWLYDGNVSLSDTKHVFLTLTACLFAVGYVIPFTIIVLFGPVLQKKCSRLMLKFKLTAINDAYQGPYKTEYRWWTGAMLLVRTLLILLFTLNILGSQRLNLLFIVTVCVVMLTAMWNIGTVYKSQWVNVIESFFVANLALLAAWCEYNHQKSTTYIRDQSIIAYVLVGSALLLFTAIVLVRVIIKIRDAIVKCEPPRRYQPMDVPLESVTEQHKDKTPTITCTYIDFKHSESEMEP